MRLIGGQCHYKKKDSVIPSNKISKFEEAKAIEVNCVVRLIATATNTSKRFKFLEEA